MRMSGSSFLPEIASAERLKQNITSTPVPDRLGLETTIPAAETNSGGSRVPDWPECQDERRRRVIDDTGFYLLRRFIPVRFDPSGRAQRIEKPRNSRSGS
jgi:hypothetical protein